MQGQKWWCLTCDVAQPSGNAEDKKAILGNFEGEIPAKMVGDWKVAR